MRVELKSIKKIYNDRVVLDVGGSMLKSGRIYAILGPNGSGKTTLLRILAGIEKPSSGTVFYDGREVFPQDELAFMPQNIYMFDLTVLENVLLGIDKKRKGGSGARSRAIQALESLGMQDFSLAKAKSLSGGEAQRVALARTLVPGKSLVLLDEPASATDISGVELVEGYIRQENKENNSTIIFTTHNPSQAARLADEVIMMHTGRIVETGTPGEVFHSPRKQETRDFLKSWRI